MDISESIKKENDLIRNMKYGYHVRSVFSYPEIRDLTLKVERLGFESAHINDHFIDNHLEAMMLTSALAVETSKIKLGHLVLCNSYRNPAYLAKMMCTLDNISNGRALFWLGAGWYRAEYKGYGYPFPSDKQRVDELEESLVIYKKLFTESKTDFEGKFWKLKKNRNTPKSIQKPYPQIVLGTSGKRMIDIACREADGINLTNIKPDELPEYIKKVKANLKKYNRNKSEFEISSCSTITLTDNQDETKILYDSSGNLYIGYHEAIKEEMDKLERLGLDKMILWGVFKSSKSEMKDPIETFAKKVMKKKKA